MVACAGVLALQTTAQTDMATWQKILDTNLTGAFHLASCVPHLKKQPGGSMVFVSSQIGFVGHPRCRLCRLESRAERADKIHCPRAGQRADPGECGRARPGYQRHDRSGPV